MTTIPAHSKTARTRARQESAMPATTEMTFTEEHNAHTTRRAMIAEGRQVSLVALDPARDLYVFDVGPVETATATPDTIAELEGILAAVKEVSRVASLDETTDAGMIACGDYAEWAQQRAAELTAGIALGEATRLYREIVERAAHPARLARRLTPGPAHAHNVNCAVRSLQDAATALDYSRPDDAAWYLERAIHHLGWITGTAEVAGQIRSRRSFIEQGLGDAATHAQDCERIIDLIRRLY